jgi:hypothetical protein
MTHTTHADTPAVRRNAALRRFIRHYLEMVLAMVAGMVVLGPLESVALGALGASHALDRPELNVLVMATNMTVAMSAWMRFRGHTWAPVAEMAAAMYLPFVVLFVPLWLGTITEATLMFAGHLLMLPAMALAMLLRREEYTRAHHRHS